ncbi:hypothetical protein A3A95_02835 [Candidatus Nomurabacteria bacterium RIFCSPLOWO2_01_FULL_39_18]|uniref:Aspartyl/glutamyl-tRNA(Asn/Gln) amidotransferase subunit C n=1 Tax=Candidatus Nomurabacteria bacterium RIFCSPHIGHO2_01_FULL_40_24b TaxID=1801739 RepID=A0A1F6V7C8_9BACT|nr:MAG: hypothetical protein A2647_03725 [Candidatus Nomurabacteria bacterium RIFCSPHIGHO2_01_FULL_40_24b]OGI89599.1 MAG: hypothetical protein A3A95_02835 [Candidatus Nomurabacteria bacterium RIFCSPLOWO2_01_FULL_39_18]
MNIKDVENLAKLARIELTEEEKSELLSDMDSILEYVKQVEEMKVEDTKSELSTYNVWREDKIESRDFSRELITKQFPASKNGFLKVKKIL